jgi:DNA polymerase III delta prime subunit
MYRPVKIPGMHAFLVTAPPPGFPPGPDTLYLEPDTSLGIADIRTMTAFLSKKPLQKKQNTVLILAAEKLTLPAQQALLKTLEEPPGASQIYLVTSQPDQLLPTILSRVSSIDASIHRSFDEKKVKESAILLDKLLAVKVGERLVILDDQEFTREKALEFLDHLEYLMHQKISSPPLKLRGGAGEGDITKIVDLIYSTRKYLKSNVNIRLAMDHFALSL